MASVWDRKVLPWLVDKACKSAEILEERRAWVPRASGRVLEIGVGSGLNLAFYDPKRVERVVGLDPSRELLARARPRAQAARVPVELVAASAEDLPFDAASFDSVVSTYTLCSVREPGRALAELRRVLAPGGVIVFVEHGAAPDARPRAVQRGLTPVWRRVAGNCHLDRDVRRELEGAGLRLVEVREAYGLRGPRWVSFTTAGIAAPA